MWGGVGEEFEGWWAGWDGCFCILFARKIGRFLVENTAVFGVDFGWNSRWFFEINFTPNFSRCFGVEMGELRAGFWLIFSPKKCCFYPCETRDFHAQKPASKNKNYAVDSVAQPLFMSILHMFSGCQKQQFWQKWIFCWFLDFSKT